MSIPDHQLPVSARFVRRSFVFACAALLLLSLSSSTNAGTVFQFAQINPADVVTATRVGGTTTLTTTGNADGAFVSIPVLINNFLGVTTTIPVFETFLGPGLTSVGPAFPIGPLDFQAFVGTIAFTSGPGGTGVNYLTATFLTPGSNFLSGLDTGGSAGLSSAQPPATLTLTSFFATLFPPTSMSISFSNVTPGLGIAGGSIASFTAQNAGTFSAGLVPEPGTFCLGSFAIVLGALAYGKKRMKAASGKV